MLLARMLIIELSGEKGIRPEFHREWPLCHGGYMRGESSIFTLSGPIAAVVAVVGAFALGHGVEEAANGRPEGVLGSPAALSRSALSLAKSCSIGFRSGL
jgi:hypothetical protein